MAVIHFAFMVARADGTLFDKLMDEMPRFICKCNRIYRNMIRRHGARGIWDKDVLPVEFIQQREELTACSNALVGFLSSNQIRRTPDGAPNELYISLEGLRDAVLGYAIKNNVERPQWGPDYYRGPIAVAGLRLGPEKDRKKYPRHGSRICRGPFVYGLDLEINCEIAESNGQEAFAAEFDAAAASALPPRKRPRVEEPICV